MEEGIFLSDINPEIIIDVIFAIHATLTNKLDFLKNFPLVNFLKIQFFSYLRGISTPKGIELIEQTLRLKDFYNIEK